MSKMIWEKYYCKQSNLLKLHWQTCSVSDDNLHSYQVVQMPNDDSVVVLPRASRNNRKQELGDERALSPSGIGYPIHSSRMEWHVSSIQAT